MFLSVAPRLQSWWQRHTEDILGWDLVSPDEAETPHVVVDAPTRGRLVTAQPLPLGHPHRVPVRIRRQRRHGDIAPAPAHCISPVRPRDLASSRSQGVDMSRR
jgi:hypothetical protein